MRAPADRLQQIENLVDVLGHLEIEPHLSEMKERRGGETFAFPPRR